MSLGRVLVVGGDGQLGAELRRRLAADAAQVLATTRSGRLADGGACEALDLGEAEAIAPLLRRLRPDHVVNAAAYTAVDRAESEPALAQAINAVAPGRLAQACAALGIGLIHFSTDYVFDGRGQRPYREDDATAPLNVYGRSKLDGERAVAASGARHLILRTAWVYAADHGHNFLHTMLRLGGEREELRVVADQRGSPTPTWLLADAVARILERGIAEPGVRHLAAAGETTWHGFAEAIFAAAVADGRLARAPRVLPIATAEYPTPARRPAYSVLDTRMLREEYGLELPDWREGLRAAMAR
ncbi:dTDP-4-dehydrorhamnose reductase [Lysobacter enzymogenes]|uniref:dTDP-4-dehydrorhamnose reductase n=1 Tax=Lysobacter enzymogenes TaxID=69 RepID=A0A3N2RIJ5_LYSEN|nr:dTDP-4-dehydrorhamnose reductase [Lysobacter enzymogenes]ROU07277.1 dTDP-4-dehydrorhamnose reductase [Lysobacter enzymogenes]